MTSILFSVQLPIRNRRKIEAQDHKGKHTKKLLAVRRKITFQKYVAFVLPLDLYLECFKYLRQTKTSKMARGIQLAVPNPKWSVWTIDTIPDIPPLFFQDITLKLQRAIEGRKDQSN